MLSRRHITASLVAAPFVLGSKRRAEARAGLDLAIIGAGAAGLAAAHEAHKLGMTARLFEARDRVGGRIHTDTHLGTPFDAGAFYIHFAERNPWFDIARDLKFELVDDNSLGGGWDVFRAGQRIPVEERGQRRGAFGRINRAVEDELGLRDFSFTEAALKIGPDLVEAAASMTLLSLGEEPDRVSVKDYQQLDSGEDFVLPQGYGALLDAYAKPLDIALATPVSGVDVAGDSARLTTAKGVVEARAVLVTVPVSLLQAGGIRFAPDLPAAMGEAIHGLGMGALTKVALKLERERFGLSPWTQFFDSGAPGSGELINFEFWPFERDLVIAFIGGDFARGLAKAGEAVAVQTILDRLVLILGERARTAFQGGRLAGWSADPWSMGSYSIAKPGHAGAREAMTRVIAGKLAFAGEANAGIASMTAGGAALSAQRAVRDLKRAMQGEK